MSDPSYIVLNEKLLKEQEAMISPVNRGMMYGDGCFETLRSYSGKFLRWNQHFDRLKGGLDYLGINPDIDSSEWKSQVIELLEANHLSDKEAMIRIQCWREGGRGYTPNSSKMGWMIQASEIKSDNTPLKLIVAKTRCIPSLALDRKYKLSNGLNYIQAAKEAADQHADDALMLTINGYISETSSANIFWIKDDQVFTPSNECDLLPGITRQVIIELIESNGFEITEGIFNPEELKNAEAVFCSNSLIEVREVASLDKVSFELNHLMVVKLQDNFEQFKRQELKL